MGCAYCEECAPTRQIRSLASCTWVGMRVRGGGGGNISQQSPVFVVGMDLNLGDFSDVTSGEVLGVYFWVSSS